jgi:Family of unknown function (DUF6551)
MSTATATDYKGGTTATFGDVTVEVIADIPDWYMLAWVPIEAVNVDQSYQRSLNMDFAHRIKSEHDNRVEDPPLLGIRNSGALYVVSGQHRIASAQLRGEPRVICRIVAGVNKAAEADMRLKGNVALGESSVSRFKARVAAGHADALAIVALAESFGTQVNQTPMVESGLNCVSALEKLYAIDEGTLLARVFETVKDAWGVVGGRSSSAAILNGTAWFLREHGGEFDRARLIEKMQKYGANVLVSRAMSHANVQGGSLWVNFYRALIEAYNEQLGDGSKLEARTGGWTQAKMSSGGGGKRSRSWE